jgi:hypothetical protein
MNARIEQRSVGNTQPRQSKKKRSFLFRCACGMILCSIGGSLAVATPISLLLPQSTAFSILGHSCGGIQEQAYATGFDSTTGYPTGDVYIQTRCGGSGRGGGYHVTTYSAWVGVTWDFAGNVLSWTKLATAPTVDPTFSATDANGDQVYNSATRAYLNVPAPGAPTGVTAVQSGDQFNVSWKPAPPNPTVITSSTVTAAPVNNPAATTVMTTVNGSTSSAAVGPLQPQTTYQVTVVNATAGGSGPPSNPVDVTTHAASTVPSAPIGVTGVWASNNTLLARWNAANPGNSPIDQYQVTIKDPDSGSTFTQNVSGTTLTATFMVSDVPDWTITVRAHNAAGWGPWSAPFILGGL